MDIVSDVEPWPHPVDGVALLGEIEATIKTCLRRFHTEDLIPLDSSDLARRRFSCRADP
jgi:hypothetical protein